MIFNANNVFQKHVYYVSGMTENSSQYDYGQTSTRYN